MQSMSLEQAATNEEPTVTDVTDKIAAAIDKLNGQLPLLARQQALPTELAAAHRAILRTLADEGRALSNGELATLVGADGVTAAIERLGGDDLAVLDADKTELTLDETVAFGAAFFVPLAKSDK
jgi:hypothetical protein